FGAARGARGHGREVRGRRRDGRFRGPARTRRRRRACRSCGPRDRPQGGGAGALGADRGRVGRGRDRGRRVDVRDGRGRESRRAQLVTVFGEPGLGKTRLVSQFVEGLERVTILSGRSLPYGEGVTYWPLASMIKASAAISDEDPAGDAFEKLRACCESEAVAD